MYHACDGGTLSRVSASRALIRRLQGDVYTQIHGMGLLQIATVVTVPYDTVSRVAHQPSFGHRPSNSSLLPMASHLLFSVADAFWMAKTVAATRPRTCGHYDGFLGPSCIYTFSVQPLFSFGRYLSFIVVPVFQSRQISTVCVAGFAFAVTGGTIFCPMGLGVLSAYAWPSKFFSASR